MRCSNLEIREEGTVEILKHITVEWQGNLKTIFCKCFADIPPIQKGKVIAGKTTNATS